MILFWREILPKHPGTGGIVEVKCSQTPYDEIAQLAGKTHLLPHGSFPHQSQDEGSEGGLHWEMSGHMFFADEYFGYDDAVYAAARLLRVLSQSERSLSRLLADVPQYLVLRLNPLHQVPVLPDDDLHDVLWPE